MAKHGRLTNAQWETVTSWTGGSLELVTVSDALRKIDRPAGVSSNSREATSIALFQQEPDGSWAEDEELEHDLEGDSCEGPLQ
eukprot:4166188-Amphidinium_carterae.1